jgi:hypothetical protein
MLGDLFLLRGTTLQSQDLSGGCKTLGNNPCKALRYDRFDDVVALCAFDTRHSEVALA